MRALLSGVMLLSLFLSQPAWAQDEDTIALIDLEISGDGAPELREQLQMSISKALAESGLKVTGLPKTLRALQGVPELIGCSSTPCLERIYELVPAHRFVRARITASGATYQIRLELLSPLEDETVVNTVEEDCEVCTIADLNEVAAAAATKLLGPNTGLKDLSVRIATHPTGALVIIDDVDVGNSPVDTELSLGSHRVVAELDGYTNSEMTIEVLADDSEQQRFELSFTPMAAISSDKPESAADYGIMKWIAISSSALMVTTGVALVIIDGKPTSGTKRGELYNTFGTGLASLSLGAVAGALGGWMHWKERQSKSAKSNVSVQATRGGGMAGYGFKF